MGRPHHDVPDDDFLVWLRAKNRERYTEEDAGPPPPAPDEPTTREVGMFVGRLVRREFLNGVARICWEHDVEWEWDLERDLVLRKVVVTLHGPFARVEAAERGIDHWSLWIDGAAGGAPDGLIAP